MENVQLPAHVKKPVNHLTADDIPARGPLTGAQFQLIRESLGLSQADTAQMLGVSRRVVVHAYEIGLSALDASLLFFAMGEIERVSRLVEAAGEVEVFSDGHRLVRDGFTIPESAFRVAVARALERGCDVRVTRIK